jgi:acyl carrier protein
MEHQEILNKLTQIFRETFSEPELELNPDMTANDVKNWDSLTHMLMISKVEKEFGIKFKLKELNKLKKVGDLTDAINEKTGNN